MTVNIKVFLSSTALICFEYEVGVNIKIYLLCFTGGAETGTLWRRRAPKYLPVQYSVLRNILQYLTMKCEPGWYMYHMTKKERKMYHTLYKSE